MRGKEWSLHDILHIQKNRVERQETSIVGIGDVQEKEGNTADFSVWTIMQKL